MTEGEVGVWKKLPADNDRGGGNSRKTMLIENSAWCKLFKVLGVWGEEKLGKIVEHIKGPI